MVFRPNRSWQASVFHPDLMITQKSAQSSCKISALQDREDVKYQVAATHAGRNDQFAAVDLAGVIEPVHAFGVITLAASAIEDVMFVENADLSEHGP